MNRYGRALVQRIAHGQAIAQAREIVAVPSGEPARSWANGLAALVPAGRVEPTAVEPPEVSDWRALSLWVSPKTTLEFARSELLWRMLAACRHRLVFELSGNKAWVRMILRCHRQDEQTAREAFGGLYPECAISEEPDAWWRCGNFESYHEVTAGWSAERLTLPDSLPDSVLWACAVWLRSLPNEGVGFYHCVLEPATLTDTWHREIEVAHDLSFLTGLLSPQSAMQRVPQQLPSGELRRRVEELGKKANPDLGFFGVALRIGIVSDINVATNPPRFLSALRIDGRALTLTQAPAPPKELREAFFSCGASCRSGLLLNTAEVSTLAHVLPVREEFAGRTDWPVFRDDVTVAQAKETGSLIGHAMKLGEQVPIVISPKIRARGTHMIAASGMGKSTVMKQLFLQDVAMGNGAVYLDPHGDAIKDLMALLPEKLRERCIYLNPADSAWVPCWNPLTVPAGVDLHRLAGDVLAALTRVSQDWGDRLSMVIRLGLVGLMHLPGATVHDLYNLVRQRSPESDALRARIIAACGDPVVCQFWTYDFLKSYREPDLAASRHKLIKLISGGAVSRMLSQSESRIDVRAIMNGGQILLVDLSQLGTETRIFLGSFLLALFVGAATCRADQARRERKPFSIFADEAHLFVGGKAFGDLMAQARKFNVNVVLAHQYRRQFESKEMDALLTAGSTLVGRVDRGDAEYFAKDFQGKITADEISRLPPFEMVGRIGTEIVRFHTPSSNDCDGPDADTAAAKIIQQSRERYYVLASSLAAQPRSKAESGGKAYADADLSYDVF